MRPRSSPPGTRLVAGIVLGCVGVLTGVTEAQQNLLRGRPVTVSSDLGAEWNQYPGWALCTACVTDGDTVNADHRSEYWHSNAEDSGGSWVEVTLQTPTAVDRVTIWPRSDGAGNCGFPEFVRGVVLFGVDAAGNRVDCGEPLPASCVSVTRQCSTSTAFVKVGARVGGGSAMAVAELEAYAAAPITTAAPPTAGAVFCIDSGNVCSAATRACGDAVVVSGAQVQSGYMQRYDLTNVVREGRPVYRNRLGERAGVQWGGYIFYNTGTWYMGPNPNIRSGGLKAVSAVGCPTDAPSWQVVVNNAWDNSFSVAVNCTEVTSCGDALAVSGLPSGADIGLYANYMGLYTKLVDSSGNAVYRGHRPVFHFLQSDGSSVIYLYIYYYPELERWYFGLDIDSNVVGLKTPGTDRSTCPSDVQSWVLVTDQPAAMTVDCTANCTDWPCPGLSTLPEAPPTPETPTAPPTQMPTTLQPTRPPTPPPPTRPTLPPTLPPTTQPTLDPRCGLSGPRLWSENGGQCREHGGCSHDRSCCWKMTDGHEFQGCEYTFVAAGATFGGDADAFCNLPSGVCHFFNCSYCQPATPRLPPQPPPQPTDQPTLQLTPRPTLPWITLAPTAVATPRVDGLDPEISAGETGGGDNEAPSAGGTAAAVIGSLCIAVGMVYYFGFHRHRMAETEPLEATELALNPTTGMMANPMLSKGGTSHGFSQQNSIESIDYDLPSLGGGAERPTDGAYMTAVQSNPQYSSHTSSTARSISQQVSVESTAIDYDLPTISNVERPAACMYMSAVSLNPQYVYGSSAINAKGFIIPVEGAASASVAHHVYDVVDRDPAQQHLSTHRRANPDAGGHAPAVSGYGKLEGAGRLRFSRPDLADMYDRPDGRVPASTGAAARYEVADQDAQLDEASTVYRSAGSSPQHRANVMYTSADSAVPAGSCNYRSQTDGLSCKSDAVAGSARCARHTCPAAGCSSAKSSSEAVCPKHAASSSPKKGIKKRTVRKQSVYDGFGGADASNA